MYLFILLVLLMFYFMFSNEILGMNTDGGDDFSKMINYSGADDPEMETIGYDYAGLNSPLIEYILVTWRNTIGDLAAPKYEQWEALRDLWSERGDSVGTPTAMIMLIWFFWILA